MPALSIVNPSDYDAPRPKSNAGAIAGGVVGGVAALAVVGLALFFWRRKRGAEKPKFMIEDTPPEYKDGEDNAMPTY